MTGFSAQLIFWTIRYINNISSLWLPYSPLKLGVGGKKVPWGGSAYVGDSQAYLYHQTTGIRHTCRPTTTNLNNQLAKGGRAPSRPMLAAET